MTENLSRRTFVKGMVAAGALTATAATLGSCGGTTTTNVPKKWDRETDVVIVGYGGAGAAAAIAAREAGAEVIVLEKREVPGGSTAICGGIIYAANTSVQKAAGIEDSADKMYQHWLNAGKGFNNPELVRIAADQSAANIEQLIKLGGTFPNPPTVTGAEVNVGSEPIARAHTVSYGELSGGSALFGVLADGAKKAGAEILMETPGKELIVDGSGVVVGIRAESEDGDLFIKARKAVVLTTGGFTRNKEMLAAFTRDGYYSQPLGTPGLDGDGHKMAFALGADVANISECLGIPGITLPGAVSATYAFWSFIPTFPGLFINLHGKRFCDEFSFYDWKNTALLAQPDHRCFSVFDDAARQAGPGMIVLGFSEDLAAEVAAGTVMKADTLAELAEKMGIPAAQFEATIAKWNADVAAGADTEFGRVAGLGPVATAPYYAFATYPTSFDNSGGLKINAKAQVVDVWGAAIPRLYAAGQVSGGLIGEHYSGSGSAINCLLTFGRIAGQSAAAEVALK